MTEPSVAAEFKRAMRRFPATVSILTCADGDEWAGMTVTAVSSLSMDPPALLVCVNRASSIFPLLMKADTFCLNVLEVSQQAVAGHFAGNSPQGRPRFAHGRWRLDEGGNAPILEGAAATLLCRRAELHPFGTHAILIGTACSVVIEDEDEVDPSLYYQGGFGRFVPDSAGDRPLKKAC